MPSTRQPPLKVGDKVSVAVRHFGEEYARARGGARWASEALRDPAVVVDKHGGKYLLDFDDEDEKRWWARSYIRFVERAETSRSRGASSSAQSPVKDTNTDSEESDEEAVGVLSASEEEPEEEGGGVESLLLDDDDQDDEANDELDGWVRNDDQNIDERQKQGFCHRSEPVWVRCPPSCAKAKDDDDPTSYFFDVCLSWFPKQFFAELADKMQEEGRAKGATWASWRVTMDDVWQWIGVWFYMLAFDEKCDRRAYFNSPLGSRRQLFRPRHIIEETLVLSRSGGVKGVKWFENMLTCFTLPGGEAVREDDPFKLVRYMWESCRLCFVDAITPGWLVTVDESMVKWMGRSMPGLMVVPRKPTPIGLEVHTVCCSLSGILVNFEVYEGAEAMANKEFVNELTEVGAINKSTALTLRCVKPYFSSVIAPLPLKPIHIPAPE